MVLLDLFLLTTIDISGMLTRRYPLAEWVTVLDRLCLLVFPLGQVLGALISATIGRLKWLVSLTRWTVPWHFLGWATLKPWRTCEWALPFPLRLTIMMGRL